MLPLSICCLVFGFSTIRFRNSTVNKTVKAYCCLVTIFGLTCWSVKFIQKLLDYRNLKFAGCVYLFMDTVRITMQTYYRVKCAKNQNILSDILENINYVDKRLAREGIRAQHTRNFIVCILYPVISILLNMLLPRTTIARVNISKALASIHETTNAYNTAVRAFTYYSALFFLMQFVFLMYIIVERMKLVRYAFVNFKENESRKLAWNIETSCFIIAGNFRRLMIEEKQQQQRYLNQIKTLLYPMCDVFNIANGWYKHFFYCCIFYLVFSTSLAILFTTIAPGAGHMIRNLDHFIQHVFIPLCLVTHVSNEFQRIKKIVHNLYYTNGWISLKSKTINPLYSNCLYSDKIFGCGYFKMKWTLLSVVFHFVSLLVFAMLPQHNRCV